MRKIETKSKKGWKNTPRNKMRRILKALKTASGQAIEDLTFRFNLWREKLGKK